MSSVYARSYLVRWFYDFFTPQNIIRLDYLTPRCRIVQANGISGSEKPVILTSILETRGHGCHTLEKTK